MIGRELSCGAVDRQGRGGLGARGGDTDRDSVQSTADGGVSMIIHDKKNFVAGALYVSFGALVAIGSASYDLGTAQRMGPGYFPLARSEEHTSELQSLMRISYAVFCLKKKKHHKTKKI